MSKAGTVSLNWENINFQVKDRGSKQKKQIIQDSSGAVFGGQLLALMGPSGSGKTSLLNILARRTKAQKGEDDQKGSIRVNGKELSGKEFRAVTAYVEQEDTLLGSLTVKETVLYTAALVSPCAKHTLRSDTTDSILKSLGLWASKDTIVGTPLKKGISGGQKRRLSVATQLVTNPSILFLDEPTSGLDSTASYEVISSLKKLATERNMAVIASIHQPSTSTFELFDQCILLAKGQTVYSGPVDGVVPFFEYAGLPCPNHTNPAEHMLEMTNTDFTASGSQPNKLEGLVTKWKSSPDKERRDKLVAKAKEGEVAIVLDDMQLADVDHVGRCYAAYIHVLRVQTNIQRSLRKVVRDPLAYAVRLVMYVALGLLMATTFLTTPSGQAGIQLVLNSLFFSAAFLSFMCVAYIPAFLEDLAVFRREKANGIGSPTGFLLANLIVGLPFLLIITLGFAVIVYWSIPYRTGGFGLYMFYLFLDLVAGESLVVLFSVSVPIFVVALAGTAFANGLWMVIGGFLVPPNVLNTFWKHSFWYINYQRYVFFGLVRNEVAKLDYACEQTSSGCNCMYVTSLQPQCEVSGYEVAVNTLEFTGSNGLYIGVLIAIIAGMRFISYLVLRFKR